MGNTKGLNWSERFALIDHYKPSDEKICQVFSVSNDELVTAREMRTGGNFVASNSLDVNNFAGNFGLTASAAKKSSTKASKVPSKTTKPSSTTHSVNAATPTTATMKKAEPKKRGRKGDKIANAFTAIPVTPTPVDTFASTYGVSLAVLRQSKRFDHSGLEGAVRVKKDRETGTLMVWREIEAK